MRGNKEAWGYQWERVIILNKPYCGEVGIIIGRGRHIKGKGKLRSRYPRFSYRVMLLDPKWENKVVAVPECQLFPDDIDKYYNADDSSYEDWYPGVPVVPEDSVTSDLLSSALVRKVKRLGPVGLAGIDIPIESKRKLSVLLVPTDPITYSEPAGEDPGYFELAGRAADPKYKPSSELVGYYHGFHVRPTGLDDQVIKGWGYG